MATDKPRFTITIDDDTLERVSDYKKSHNISTQSKAIASLVESALSDLEAEGILPKKKTAPLYSNEAMKLAKDFDSLDRWGKEAVRKVADVEIARHEDEKDLFKLLEEDPINEKERKVIPLFLIPAAAGYASPLFGEDYEPYTLKDDDPQGANFAIKVQGDSMEPYFPNGSTVFCNRDPLADGDIGVFCVDGESYIKQYHYDTFGGTYLFSLNRKRDDMDIILPSSTGRHLACLGRVITKRRYPVPGTK